MRLCSLLVLFACPAVYGQNLPQPLTQVNVCRRFTASVVEVDSDTMRGTGFIVAPDGWIITALHVVADRKSLIKYGNISVSILRHSRPFPAEIVSPIDNVTSLRDFAILKIDETALPALELGNEVDVENGSPIAIIGLPLSASFDVVSKPTPVPHFCLFGTVAAQTSFPLGNLQFRKTIFFQGISIKGISGAPIISLDSGKVIGVVSTKLTAISMSLEQQRRLLDNPPLMMFGANGFDMDEILRGLIDALDTQLANGLGSGTGASDAADALRKAQAEYKPHNH
jgi:S1-C subfamily serine protease